MNTTAHDDHGLARRFAEWKAADRAAGTPSLDATLEAARSRAASRPARRPLGIAFDAPALRVAAALVLLAALGYAVTARQRPPVRAAATFELATWRAPTDTLLSLAGMNAFTGPVGLTGSVLDLGTAANTTRATPTTPTTTHSHGDTL